MAQETEIDLPSRGGLRGRIERLAHEYMLKASALKITIEIIDEDDRKTALQAAPKKFLAAIGHRNGHNTTKRGVVRKPESERLDDIVAFLTDHDGATTNEIADAIGVQNPNTVTKLAPRVARATMHGGGRRGPSTWTLKQKPKTEWMTIRADDGAPLAQIRRKKKLRKVPRAQRLQAITQYLKAHPEAKTVDVATALGRSPRSSLVKLIREVAKPAYPTTSTQPIQWVLK